MAAAKASAAPAQTAQSPGTQSSTTQSAVTQSPETPSLATRLSTAPSPPPRASLLGLPPELRNKITFYAVVSDEPIKVTVEVLKKYSIGLPLKTYRFTMIAPLTMVSRQLRQETRRLFIEENTFDFSEPLLDQYVQTKRYEALADCLGVDWTSVLVHQHRFVYDTLGHSGHVEAKITATMMNQRVVIANVDYDRSKPGYEGRGLRDIDRPKPESFCCSHHIEKVARTSKNLLDLIEGLRQPTRNGKKCEICGKTQH